MPLQIVAGEKHAARLPPAPPVQINVFSFFSLPGTLTSPMRQKKKGKVRVKDQRWGAGDSQPVAGAKLELYDSKLARVAEFTAKNPRPISSVGQQSVDLAFLDDGDYILLLVPPASHELRPRSNPAGLATGSARDAEIRRPVGPWDNFHGDPPGHRRFRQLEIKLIMRGGEVFFAFPTADMFFTLPNGARVSHGATLLDGRDLWVDWRPDFVQIENSKLKKPPVNRHGRQLRLGEFIHLHQTDGPTPGSAIDQFLLQVAPEDARGAHYLVDTNGFVIKLCHENVHANHAGRSHWYDLDSCRAGGTIPSFNSISVGIEHVHADGNQFAGDQLAGTNWVLTALRAELPTSHFNVLGDGETAINFDRDPAQKSLGRKINCPGFTYDWTVIENAGNSTRPQRGATVPHAFYDNFFKGSPKGELRSASSAAVAGLQATLASLGYFVELSVLYDNATERAVEAFQGRYFSGGRAPTSWRPCECPSQTSRTSGDRSRISRV